MGHRAIASRNRITQSRPLAYLDHILLLVQGGGDGVGQRLDTAGSVKGGWDGRPGKVEPRLNERNLQHLGGHLGGRTARRRRKRDENDDRDNEGRTTMMMMMMLAHSRA